MKKFALLFAAGLMLNSCSGLLDTEPYDQFTKDGFFKSESNVKLYANYFYSEFSGYGNAGSYGDYYFNFLNDDQGTTGTANWTFTAVPGTAGAWNNPYTEIRRANILIEALPGIEAMSAASQDNWMGVARLYRAMQHYKLVRGFGDCYWVDHTLDAAADAAILYGKRTARNEVMDHVLDDLNFACTKITADASSRTAINKWVALAIKAEITLFEGTYSKYVKNDASRASKYLTECKAACQEIMNNTSFKLNGNFRANFNSPDLAGNTEMIMYKHYVYDVLCHSTIDYTCGSTQVHGMTKDAFDSYLFKDGKPLASTTCDKSDKGKLIEKDDKSGFGVQKFIDITNVLAQRDPRLSAQVDDVLQFPGCGYARYGGAQSTASSGYGVLLFDNVEYSAKNADRQSINKNYSDAPLYTLAEVLLDYAEACAELGACTQADLDKSVNLLRDRVGMPHMSLTPDPDPANKMGVSNLIYEIRRERRVEMMYCKNDRYYSLQRWNMLKLLDTTTNPNLSLGANVGAFKDSGIDMSQISMNAEGYIDYKNGKERKWEDKYNLFPVPADQITLNPEIGQNPGW